MESTSINYNFIKKLVENWPRRAGVVNYNYLPSNNIYDENIPDYPVEILPFSTHPYFKKISDEQKQQILTWAWIFYNERVIIAEERIANPAFSMLLTGKFPGVNEFYIKQALQQCLIDEHFHTLMHMIAINETKKLRAINISLQCPYSIIYTQLLEEEEKVEEVWQKNLLILVWTVVSEISINAYLSLLSTNNSIQPMHKYITWIHNKDEHSHSKIMIEVSKKIYYSLNDKQKKFFISSLDKALYAFTAHDLSIWTFILKSIGVSHYYEIIKDCEKNLDSTQLLRDFSLLKKFAFEINIINQLDFFVI